MQLIVFNRLGMHPKTLLKKQVKDGFAGAFEQAISAKQLSALCRRHEPTARRKRKLSTGTIVRNLVFHQLREHGTLAQHGAMSAGRTITDSAYAQRRKRLGKKLFDELLDTALKPLADAREHPGSFHKGMRLVGIDGTQMSVLNTPGNAALPKAKTRRAKAAFAKIKLVTAMELGLHNPLAAQTGTLKDYEVNLAMQLLPKLPPDSLVIVDRLYGVAKHYLPMREQLAAKGSELLVRVRNNLNVRLLEKLPDGSALVEVRQGGKKIVVREIRALLKVDGQTKPVNVRLWTSLLDASEHPADELVRLYALRWEQELGYKEFKLDMRNAQVLDSHSEHTALQEVAARVLAMACVARVRARMAHSQGRPASTVSFRKVLLCTLGLWEAFWLGGASLGKRQKQAMLEKYYEWLEREALLAPRRVRRCPRAVRKPVSGWPRLIKRTQSKTQVIIKITP